jgi:polyhydroxybutyrate depolymerase
MNAIADTTHFLVAYPQGLSVTRTTPDYLPNFLPGLGTGWHVPDIPSQQDDIAFLSQLIESLEMSHAVDSQRVHILGLSLGGSMALHAGAQLKDQLASVASVAAFPTDLILANELPGAPISQLVIHGTADGVFSIGGNPRYFGTLANTMDALRLAGECENEFTETTLPDLDSGDGSTVTLFQAMDCVDGREISYYRVDGGGHTWPGADQSFFNAGLGNINRDIHSAEVIWQFFQRNPMPSSPTGLEADIPVVPADYAISNYPNPFNPTTTIRYHLAAPSQVSVTVHDISGRHVATLQQGEGEAGTHAVLWNGTDKSGAPVSTGVYLCTLQAGEHASTIKMVYLR